MLSIGYHEISSGKAGRAAPSPMTLSRYDTFALRKDNRFNYVNDADLYLKTKAEVEKGLRDEAVWDEPRRAYFHPGVGWWQLDDAGKGTSWLPLNHGQRADTGLGLNAKFDSRNPDSGGEVIASLHASTYCNASSGSRGESIRWLQASQWGGCGYASWRMHRDDPMNHPDYTNDCYSITTPGLWVPYGSSRDDLNVTTSHNAGHYSTDGGVTERSCRWVRSAAEQSEPTSEYGCYWYDTTRPEGDAGVSNPWGYSPEPRSPLAAPFVAFTQDSKRFTVFPGPVMTALKPADHATAGGFQTWVKAVPHDVGVRVAGKGLWSTAGYVSPMGPDGASHRLVLQVQVCDGADWVVSYEADGSCRWFGVNDVAFARRMGIGPSPLEGPL